MRRSRIQYLMTWVAMGILLGAGMGLMALSWNGTLTGTPLMTAMVLLWVILSASGIFLFLLAVKKAHRLMVQEDRRIRQTTVRNERERKKQAGSTSKERKELDFAGTARKLVRRAPAEATHEELGKELLKNLARELEIMAGIYYKREKDGFRAVATYAMAAPDEPYSFREGEGLTGQVARNRHMMVLTRLPEAHREVYSGLGKAPPSYLAIVPLVYRNRTIAVIECSGYRYQPGDIESMFRIFARDLMEKTGPTLS